MTTLSARVEKGLARKLLRSQFVRAELDRLARQVRRLRDNVGENPCCSVGYLHAVEHVLTLIWQAKK